jgi:hypothetical protein
LWLLARGDYIGARAASVLCLWQLRIARLLTPLLLMAPVIAAGVLFYALTGHALAAV